MMPSGHRGSSTRKPSNAGTYATSRGYHKSPDSGVGSLSDHDGLATNPGAYAVPPEYGQPSSSSRRLDQALLDIERLKADKQNLYVQNQELKVELRDIKEHALKLEEHASKLKEDNTILNSECKRLREDNHLLRSSPPRDSAASISTSSSSGLRRRDSKRGSPSQREEVELDQRLRDRLGGKTDKKTEKGPSSSTSAQSGHSGHSRDSGRSRRDSFAGARPSVIVSLPDGPPNSSRSQGLYAHSPVIPSPHVANASTPRTPATYAYRETSYFDPDQGSGDYVHEPLPRERQTKR
jgi:hypothetical protein